MTVAASELQAQHQTAIEDHHFKHFRVSVLLGHTLVPSRHSSEHLFIPSWGLDLEYWHNAKWGLGLHNDLELQTFVIEKENDEILQREYPLVATLDLLYKPWRDLVVLFGPGVEFEPTERLSLWRIGVEYEIEFFNHWDLAPSFFYDSRKDTFDTWSLALGVGRRF